jgi:hypothetical protein
MNTAVRGDINSKERIQLGKLRSEFEIFRKRYGYQDVDLDTVTTLDAVRKFLDSMDAYKAFHGRAADRCQQTAFLVCWLVKVKPAYLAQGGLPPDKINEGYAQYCDSSYNTINEHFAFGLALGNLGIEPHQVGKDMQEGFIEVIYNCNFDPAVLALALRLLVGRVKAEERADAAEAQIAQAQAALAKKAAVNP